MKIRNIRLGYWIIALNNAFFWYAPWLLFVYRFIDIRQATILQLAGMVTRILSEIPTGAFSDLVGKRRTLIIALLLSATGEILMSFSTNFTQFILVYIVIALGQSFYSGTIDAFMYDSLVEKKEENKYPSVLSRSNVFLSVSTAIATISGGFLFQFWGGLPFLLTGMAKLLGVLFTLFVTEPKVDTIIFSLKNFVAQTGKGFTNLFNAKFIKLTLLLLLLGSFSTVAYEILDDVAVVDWGYNAIGIGILFTTALVISIPSGFLYEYMVKRIKLEFLIILGVLFLVLNYIFSLWTNVYVWTFLFLIRCFYSPIRKSAIMDSLNRNSSSDIRATTISTYELLSRLPFAFLGIPIGSILKDYGIKFFSVGFSALLLVLLFAGLIINAYHSSRRDVL